MRFTLSKRSQTVQKEPGSGHESGSTPSAVYSGHLLKLGSKNRWQSRLFTFDGSGNSTGCPPRLRILLCLLTVVWIRMHEPSNPEPLSVLYIKKKNTK